MLEIGYYLLPFFVFFISLFFFFLSFIFSFEKSQFQKSSSYSILLFGFKKCSNLFFQVLKKTCCSFPKMYNYFLYFEDLFAVSKFVRDFQKMFVFSNLFKFSKKFWNFTFVPIFQKLFAFFIFPVSFYYFFVLLFILFKNFKYCLEFQKCSLFKNSFRFFKKCSGISEDVCTFKILFTISENDRILKILFTI